MFQSACLCKYLETYNECRNCCHYVTDSPYAPMDDILEHLLTSFRLHRIAALLSFIWADRPVSFVVVPHSSSHLLPTARRTGSQRALATSLGSLHREATGTRDSCQSFTEHTAPLHKNGSSTTGVWPSIGRYPKTKSCVLQFEQNC